MWRIFKRPIEQETKDAWAKMSDDVTKVAILAIPVLLYGKDSLINKLINTGLLLFSIYCGLIISRQLRQSKTSKPTTEQGE